MSKLKTTAAQRQAINDRYRNKYSWMAGPGPDLLDDVGTLLAENDRLRKQIKHHENSERFWRENILDPSDKTDDRLQEDCEYVAACTCGLCLFVGHLLSVRANVIWTGKWYVGTMSDAPFVINQAPRPVPADYINTALKTKCIANPTESHQEDWTREEYEANARLIAASPELLAAAKAALSALQDELTVRVRSFGRDEPEWKQHVVPLRTVIEQLKAAIKKAEGK